MVYCQEIKEYKFNRNKIKQMESKKTEELLLSLKAMGVKPELNLEKKYVRFPSNGSDYFSSLSKEIVKSILGVNFSEFYYAHDTQYIYFNNNICPTKLPEPKKNLESDAIESFKNSVLLEIDCMKVKFNGKDAHIESLENIIKSKDASIKKIKENSKRDKKRRHLAYMKLLEEKNGLERTQEIQKCTTPPISIKIVDKSDVKDMVDGSIFMDMHRCGGYNIVIGNDGKLFKAPLHLSYDDIDEHVYSIIKCGGMNNAKYFNALGFLRSKFWNLPIIPVGEPGPSKSVQRKFDASNIMEGLKKTIDKTI